MADWKANPLVMLTQNRALLENQDPDAKASIDRYYGRGAKGLKKFGEFLQPIKPGDVVHHREEPDVSNTYCKGGRVRHGHYHTGGSANYGTDYRKK